MATTEPWHYRGYDILPQRQWSGWCVGIYPTRSDLPLLARSTLQTLVMQKEEALVEAKQVIDRVLSQYSRAPRL
ncbi:MAG TPA: hypothetical protein VFK91_08655 [Methyloceanibacter sp.]|nr:hypothetical protein [Methyloceanibacter sp.]